MIMKFIFNDCNASNAAKGVNMAVKIGNLILKGQGKL